jgi:hypothetical protein
MSQRTQIRKGAKELHVADRPASVPRTFEGVLRQMVDLAQAILPEQRRTAASVELDRSRALVRERPAAGLTPQQKMTQALEKLGPEVALKLRTVMVAGRDGRRITDVQVNITMADTDSAFAIAARDLSENGPLLVDYLRRGHAMACALELDIEKPYTEWASPAPKQLEERVWLSFGRQLALSRPEDWSCIGFLGTEQGEPLTKLYLRRAELGWWSFHTLLDRPSAAVVEAEKRALESRRESGVTSGPMHALAHRTCSAETLALSRAIKAIRARVGLATGEPLRPSPAC